MSDTSLLETLHLGIAIDQAVAFLSSTSGTTDELPNAEVNCEMSGVATRGDLRGVDRVAISFGGITLPKAREQYGQWLAGLLTLKGNEGKLRLLADQQQQARFMSVLPAFQGGAELSLDVMLNRESEPTKIDDLTTMFPVVRYWFRLHLEKRS